MKFGLGLTGRLLCFLLVGVFLLTPILVIAQAGSQANEGVNAGIEAKKAKEAQLVVAEEKLRTLMDNNASDAEINAADAEVNTLKDEINALGRLIDPGKESESFCSWRNPGACIVEAISVVLNSAFSSLGLFLNATIGGFFRLSLDLSIVHFADLANKDIIKTLWKAVRDFLNITLLFILLYVAIRTILGLKSVSVQKTVVSVILVGLLINFSMLVPRVLIDGSNLVTLFFYNAAGEKTADGKKDLFTPAMRAMNQPDPYNAQAHTIDKLGSIIFSFLGRIIALGIISIILFTIALLFFVRAIVLLFLIIMSPIFVIGFAVPQLKKHGDQWWSELMNQVMFAPTFMLLYLFSLRIAEAGGSMATRSGSNAAYDTIISIGFTLVTLVFTMNLALKSGGFGYKYATDLGGKFKNKLKGYGVGALGGSTIGLGKYGFNRVIGSGASAMADSEKAQKLMAASPLFGGAIRSGLQKLGEGYDKSSEEAGKKRAERAQTIKDSKLQAKYLANTSGKLDTLLRGSATREGAMAAIGASGLASMISKLTSTADEKTKKALLDQVHKMSIEEQQKFHQEATKRLNANERNAYLTDDAEGNNPNFSAETKEKMKEAIFGGLSDHDRAELLSGATSDQAKTYQELRKKLTSEEKDRLSNAEAQIAKKIGDDNKRAAYLDKIIDSGVEESQIISIYKELSAEQREVAERLSKGLRRMKTKLRNNLTAEELRKTQLEEAQNKVIIATSDVLARGASSRDIAGALNQVISWKNPKMIGKLTREAVDTLAGNSGSLGSITGRHLNALAKNGRATKKLLTALTARGVVLDPTAKAWLDDPLNQALFT